MQKTTLFRFCLRLIGPTLLWLVQLLKSPSSHHSTGLNPHATDSICSNVPKQRKVDWYKPWVSIDNLNVHQLELIHLTVPDMPVALHQSCRWRR